MLRFRQQIKKGSEENITIKLIRNLVRNLHKTDRIELYQNYINNFLMYSLKINTITTIDKVIYNNMI